MAERWLKASQAAEMLGICDKTFYGLVNQGLIPRYRITKRTVRYAESDILQYIRSRSETVIRSTKFKRKPASRHSDGTGYKPGDILV